MLHIPYVFVNMRRLPQGFIRSVSHVFLPLEQKPHAVQTADPLTLSLLPRHLQKMLKRRQTLQPAPSKQMNHLNQMLGCHFS